MALASTAHQPYSIIFYYHARAYHVKKKLTLKGSYVRQINKAQNANLNIAFINGGLFFEIDIPGLELVLSVHTQLSEFWLAPTFGFHEVYGS